MALTSRDQTPERYLRQIWQVMASGIVSTEEIAERLHLSPNKVYRIAYQAGLRLDDPRAIDPNERTRQIEESKITKIRREREAEQRKLSRAREAEQRRIQRAKENQETKINDEQEARTRVITAIEGGEKSLERLCQVSGRAITGFHDLCKKYNISLPEGLIPYRFKPDLDEMIKQGFSLPDMAVKKHETAESVRLYVIQSGQHAA